MHHQLQARHTRPLRVPSQKMEILHPRRSTKHKKLQISAVAVSPQLSVAATSTFDRHASSKQPNGAVVTHALPYATRVRLSSRISALVLQSAQVYDRGKSGVQRTADQTTAQSLAAVHIASFED